MLVGNDPIPELILLPRPPAFAKSRPTDPCCSTEADDQPQLNHPPDRLNHSPRVHAYVSVKPRIQDWKSNDSRIVCAVGCRVGFGIDECRPSRHRSDRGGESVARRSRRGRLGRGSTRVGGRHGPWGREFRGLRAGRCSRPNPVPNNRAGVAQLEPED